jgi:hypothetical protein
MLEPYVSFVVDEVVTVELIARRKFGTKHAISASMF